MKLNVVSLKKVKNKNKQTNKKPLARFIMKKKISEDSIKLEKKLQLTTKTYKES